MIRSVQKAETWQNVRWHFARKDDGGNHEMKLLKAGTRAKCAVCDTEVMVVRAAPAEVLVSCGGAELIAMDAAKTAGPHAAAAPTQVAQVGKRYVNAAATVELLCTKGGKGELAIDGESLSVKQAKPLPSSD